MELTPTAHLGDRMKIAGSLQTGFVTGLKPRALRVLEAATAKLPIVSNDKRIISRIKEQPLGSGIVRILNELQRHNAVALQTLQGLLDVTEQVSPIRNSHCWPLTLSNQRWAAPINLGRFARLMSDLIVHE